MGVREVTVYKCDICFVEAEQDGAKTADKWLVTSKELTPGELKIQKANEIVNVVYWYDAAICPDCQDAIRELSFNKRLESLAANRSKRVENEN